MKSSLLVIALISTLSACHRPKPAPGRGAEGTDPKAVVAMIGSQPITLAEVDKAAGRDLYELRERTLDSLIVERVIEPEAKKAGLKGEEYLRQQVEARVPPVSDTEAAEFFAKNQSQLGPQFAGKKFEEVKDVIVQGLTGERRRAKVSEVIEEMKAKAGVKVLLVAPRVNVAAVGPSKGPANAKVTIVEFSDFQCPYCARGRDVIDQVVKAYGDKVRVVFRDFPLSFHKDAQKAAEAGQCANDQGKFWEMHDWMFSNQHSLGAESLKSAAKKLGLDSSKFDECLTSGKHAQLVAENLQAGQQAGVRGTPAFFINGKFLNGAVPFEQFKAEIDRALAQ